MKLLLNDRLAPITSTLSFIEADIETCTIMVEMWKKDTLGYRGVDVTHKTIPGNLETTLRVLLPLQRIESLRYLLIPTKSNWTAYFDNGYRGTDGSGIGYLAEKLKCRTLWVVATPHVRGTKSNRQGRPGNLIMVLWGANKTDWFNRIREIRLWNDIGKWHFTESGPPLPFENTAKYNAKKKTERFTFEMLETYLQHLGVFAFSEEFYEPQKAMLIELTQASMLNIKYPLKADNVSLEEARKLNGIDDGGN